MQVQLPFVCWAKAYSLDASVRINTFAAKLTNPMSKIPVKRPRLMFIDMARSIAIILMLEGHFVDQTLGSRFRSPDAHFVNPDFFWYDCWHIIRGYTSPMFLTMTGLIFVYLLYANKGEPFFGNERVKKGFKRVAELLFWGYILMPKGFQGKDGIDQILTRLTSFCIQYNVHVFLVAHPTKMKKHEKTGRYEIPDLYSVSGSSDFRNQTHNGLCVYREFGNDVEPGHTMVINLKTKYDFQGKITSSTKFNWNNDNRRFYVDGCINSSKSLINYKNEETIEVFDSLQPNTEFDNVPF